MPSDQSVRRSTQRGVCVLDAGHPGKLYGYFRLESILWEHDAKVIELEDPFSADPALPGCATRSVLPPCRSPIRRMRARMAPNGAWKS